MPLLLLCHHGLRCGCAVCCFTLFLDRFDDANNTLHCHITLSVNALSALMQSKYDVFSAGVCDLERTMYLFGLT